MTGKKYLFVDLETSDKAKDLKASAYQIDYWPRIIQLAYVIADEEGNELESYNTLIKPTTWKVSPDALAIHGITGEKALKEGIEIEAALSTFQSAIEKVDVVVAHNMFFEQKVLASEYIRNHIPNTWFKKSKLCTMIKSTKHCKLPGRYGNFKWPKLGELYKHLFSEELVIAHDALVDVQTCKRCFFELKKLGVIK